LGPDGAFRDFDGRLLARVTRTEGGIELRFTEAVATDPLGKMLLLTAVLRM
jgi:hypothetical protein